MFVCFCFGMGIPVRFGFVFFSSLVGKAKTKCELDDEFAINVCQCVFCVYELRLFLVRNLQGHTCPVLLCSGIMRGF